MSARARAAFPDDFNLDLLHVRALLALDRPREAIEILAATHVLPSENARDSHRLYELAHMAAAVGELEARRPGSARDHLEAALLWPESLGQGRPYDPDERLVRHLLGVVAEVEGDGEAARRAFEVAGGGGGGDRGGGSRSRRGRRGRNRLLRRASAPAGEPGGGAAPVQQVPPVKLHGLPQPAPPRG